MILDLAPAADDSAGRASQEQRGLEAIGEKLGNSSLLQSMFARGEDQEKIRRRSGEISLEDLGALGARLL